MTPWLRYTLQKASSRIDLVISIHMCMFSYYCLLLNTNLIVSSLGNVSDPSLSVVTRLVVHSQESNMHTTGGKHGNLELHINGRSVPWLGADRGHEVDFGINMTLGLSGEPLDTPHNRLLFWFVLGSSKQSLDLGLGSILGDRNLDDNVGCKELVRKVGNDLEIDGNSAKMVRATKVSNPYDNIHAHTKLDSLQATTTTFSSSLTSYVHVPLARQE
jgi:hypothetical protein